MHLTIGIRARLALAALLVTCLAGLASAGDPITARFEVAGIRLAGRGPAATPDKTGPAHDLPAKPACPQIAR